MRITLALPLALLAAGCTTGGSRVASPARLPPIPIPHGERQQLGGVLGQPAAALTRMFGQPDLDLTEGPGRKMQFGSQICVLDAYLYPPSSGRGEATVSHVDTRQRDGSTIDRASCVAALQRKAGGR